MNVYFILFLNPLLHINNSVNIGANNAQSQNKESIINPKIHISFKNLFELHSEILHYLHKNTLSQLSTYMFLVKLYTLKDQGTLLLTDKNLTIKVQYNKDSESEINFFINK